MNPQSTYSQHTIPPREITALAMGEPIDFTVKAKRANTLGTAIGLSLFGLIWMGISSLFFIGPQAASMSGLLFIMPLIFMGIGIIICGIGLRGFFVKGPWFIGTPKRLIITSDASNVRSIAWSQFSGDIERRNRGGQGSLILGLLSGHMVSRRNRNAQYVPDTIPMIGIPNVTQIESAIRNRIIENKGQ